MQLNACSIVVAVVGAGAGGVPVPFAQGATRVVGSVAPKTLSVVRAATVDTAARLSAPAASSVLLMPPIVDTGALQGRHRHSYAAVAAGVVGRGFISPLVRRWRWDRVQRRRPLGPDQQYRAGRVVDD